MFIFRLRRQGRPLTPRQVAEHPVRGFLSFEQGPKEFYRTGVMLARLLSEHDPAEDAIPYIEHARIERVRGYVQIRGLEYFKKKSKSPGQRWEQSWLCCMTEQEGIDMMLRVHAKRRTRPTPEPAPPPRRPGMQEPYKGFFERCDALDAEELESVGPVLPKRKTMPS